MKFFDRFLLQQMCLIQDTDDLLVVDTADDLSAIAGDSYSFSGGMFLENGVFAIP